MQDNILDDLLLEPQLEAQLKWQHFWRIVAMIQVLAALISTTISQIEIESIIFSGSIGSVIGLVVFYYARKSKNLSKMLFGLSAPAISLCCLILINGLDWSKLDAQKPIPIILGIYTLVLGVWLFQLLRAEK